MVLLRSKSESRMGALGWQLHSAPQHAHCSSLQRFLGPGPRSEPERNQAEGRLDHSGWGWGGGTLGIPGRLGSAEA